MQKLTCKKGLFLSCLLIGGCCDTFDNYQITVPRHDYYPSKERIHKPYVVNNTPHIRKQPLPSSYREDVKEIGLVGSHGEIL